MATATRQQQTVRDLMAGIAARIREDYNALWASYVDVLNGTPTKGQDPASIIARAIREFRGLTPQTIEEHAAYVDEVRDVGDASARADWIKSSYPELFDRDAFPRYVPGASDHWQARVTELEREITGALKAREQAKDTDMSIVTRERRLDELKRNAGTDSAAEIAELRGDVADLRPQLAALQAKANSQHRLEAELATASRMLDQARRFGN